MHETQIGRYEVVRVLGKGAMGVVCEARDPRLARTVAIKTIRADKLTPAQVAAYEARFLTEARSVARLSHPNIVSVFDSGQAGDTAYLVMEFVPGVNLKHCLNHGVKFTPWGASKVVLDVLAALDHAHRQKILHRDVKPENILLDSAGWVKLTDFGIAKILDAEDDNGTQLSGNSIGTPRYMSPEQVRGQPLDERSDLFSAGVLLYELLTGRLPFDGSNQFAIAAQILNEAPPLPSLVNPAVPTALDAVVVSAMAKHPSERFQTGEEFADALASAVHSLGGADVMARVAGAQALVAAESAGMLRWLLSRMLSGRDKDADAAMPMQQAAVATVVSAEAAAGPGIVAGSLALVGSIAGRYPTSDEGTLLYSRETGEQPVAAVEAAAIGPADPAFATATSQIVLAAPVTGVTGELPADQPPATGALTSDTGSVQVFSDSPACTQAPVAAAVEEPSAAGQGNAQGGGAARWWMLGVCVLLVALTGWWFSRIGAEAPVVPAVLPPSTVDTNQTLSDKEVLVQPGEMSAPASQSAPTGAVPTGVSNVAVPAAGLAHAVPPGKMPAKPTDGAPSGKPADARSTAKPEEAPPSPPQQAPVAQKPAAAVIAPAPPAEPCAGMGFFERESCLWKQCSTDTYRSHAACERFQTRKPGN